MLPPTLATNGHHPLVVALQSNCPRRTEDGSVRNNGKSSRFQKPRESMAAKFLGFNIPNREIQRAEYKCFRQGVRRQSFWGKLCVAMNAIPLILLAALLGSVVFYILYSSDRYRADAIRGLATNAGMHYLGNALPKSLTLKGTPFDRISKVWNVMDGEPCGTRIRAFDCKVGAGRQSWRRTLIAVESNGNAFGHLPLQSDMVIDRSGKWQILYHPEGHFNLRIAGLTPLEELEANLNAVLACSAKTSP